MFTVFNWFVKITAWIPQLFGLRIRTYYEDKRVQGKRIRGKAIIVSNHNSVWDVAVMMFIFWRRTLRCIVAEVMFNKGFFMNMFLKLLGAIRVERESHDFSFLDKSERILSRGGVVEIYPESRLPKEGEERPLEFKPSAVYLALETGAPIIPVYNSRESFKTKRSAVIIGKPINVRELYDDSLDHKDNVEKITKQLRGKIIELGEQLQRQMGKAEEKEKETV